MSCPCNRLFECEPSWIPAPPSDTAKDYFVPAKQWQCMFCGKKWGYVGDGVKVMEAPREIRWAKI